MIIDVYKKEEANEVAKAIDDLCSPNDNYGWASAGIYCFWDYYEEEILYIGLASDLSQRFKQHNGIIPLRTGSKYNKIEEYFSKNEKLGYTIFVQSPLSQPLVHRNKKQYEPFATQNNSPINDLVSNQGIEDIKRVEGILIEAYRKDVGHLTKWNDVGGSRIGQKSVMENNINIVRSFYQYKNIFYNQLISHSTIRELSNNAEWAWYENYLHGVRINMLMIGMKYEESLDIIRKNDMLNTYDEMVKSGYLKKELIV